MTMPQSMSASFRRVAAESLQVGDERVQLGLARDGRLDGSEVLIRVRIAERRERAQLASDDPRIDRCRVEPWERRHVRLGHQVARVQEVYALPLVAVAAANAREIGPRALAAPLEGPVVHGFAG